MERKNRGGLGRKKPSRLCCALAVAAVLSGAPPGAAEESAPKEQTSSVHVGFLYPGGVDLAGYSAEHYINDGLYWYYTFGIPALAAAGLSYYSDYNGNGLVAVVGVGIGSIAYAAVAYQLKVGDGHYLKLGGGYTTGIAYSGLFPALSYEMRLK